MIIRLEPHELRYAIYIGRLREKARRGSKNDRNKQIGSDRVEQDILGATGELVAAKALNCYWYDAFMEVAEKKKFKKPDVGGYEVKTTRMFPHKMLVYKDTPDDAKVLLVTPYMNDAWRVWGWQYAHLCKKPEFWNDKLKMPCWAYPKDLLNRNFNEETK